MIITLALKYIVWLFLENFCQYFLTFLELCLRIHSMFKYNIFLTQHCTSPIHKSSWSEMILHMSSNGTYFTTACKSFSTKHVIIRLTRGLFIRSSTSCLIHNKQNFLKKNWILEYINRNTVDSFYPYT